MTDTKQIKEFAQAHEQARLAWMNWCKHANVLYDAQKKKYASFVNKAELKKFIAEFGSGGYKRNGVQTYLEQVYESVFTKRRARTLELGKFTEKDYKGEFKDKRLCFGSEGFAMRYEHSTHARVYSFSEMATLIKNPDELKAITVLLQNAKQHEIAMNLVQFATFINAEDTFGDGIVAQLETPVVVHHDFDSYSNKGNTLPRIADKIELDYIEDGEVHFNLFTKPETLESVVALEKDDDGGDDDDGDEHHKRIETYSLQRIGVTLSEHDSYKNDDSYTNKMQVWVQLPGLNASMKEESDRYKAKFAKLKADIEAQFGRYLLMSMVSK